MKSLFLKNKGFLFEEKVRRMLHARECLQDCADAETDRLLVEIKSCQLFLRSGNGNRTRKGTMMSTKPCVTNRLRRFVISRENHVALKVLADEQHKQAIYVFVLVVGKQFLHKRLSWHAVNLLVRPEKDMTLLALKTIFKPEEHRA